LIIRNKISLQQTGYQLRFIRKHKQQAFKFGAKVIKTKKLKAFFSELLKETPHFVTNHKAKLTFTATSSCNNDSEKNNAEA
jgi:hypothetical protein